MTRRSSLFWICAGMPLLAASVFLLFFVRFVRSPVTPPAPLTVIVESGRSFGSVAVELEEKGVVSNASALKVLVRFRGDAQRVQAGEYDFEEAATPQEVLDRLVTGDVRRYRFTVPEGLTVREIARKLEEEGFSNPAAFQRLAFSEELAKRFGFEGGTLEGYLFPETYSLPAKISAESLLETMVDEFRRRISNDVIEAGRRRGLTLHQLVTLASIIQKEAGNLEEMPLISAVFHNRLKRGMPLQADPTVIYGIEDFDGNLTRKDLRTLTPYNTYRIKGLPPGPIANPGEVALAAAAFPADTDYLYFVARGDGTHVFSRSLTEHNAMVRRYQLKR